MVITKGKRTMYKITERSPTPQNRSHVFIIKPGGCESNLGETAWVAMLLSKTAQRCSESWPHAKVFGNARVIGEAIVSDEAVICHYYGICYCWQRCFICGEAVIGGNTNISDSATVYGAMC